MAAIVLTAAASTGRAETGRLNVVLVVADDLGWADLGCCGSTYHRTPNLDRLAAGGVRFTSAYAAACICSPTRAALLTGKYPARLGLTDWLHLLADAGRPADRQVPGPARTH
jgi:arylsulfatase A-like enzyme